jgi:hypothetical protein
MNWRVFWREFDKGLIRFSRNTKVHLLIGLYMLCDILPHLPDAIAKKIVDKVLNALGLGD